MKMISEYVSDGIACLSDLQGALQLAMQLEFATIPPYLCAQWSIRRDPDRVESIIHRVVSEEMLHLASTGNLLTAIGGVPSVAHQDFVPDYPIDVLPGGIRQEKPIDLRPLDLNQLAVFMQIENPAFPPVALRLMSNPVTIGDFYDTIIEAFRTIKPGIDPNANSIPVPSAPQIRDFADAIHILEAIKTEGEGLRDSPEQPSSHRTALAHYYAFKEVHEQRRLVENNGKWSFSGAPVILPEVFQFGSTGDEHSASADFNRIFSLLLVAIETCWTRGVPLNVAGMFGLKIAGEKLIAAGGRPEFRWDPSVIM